MTLDGFIFTLLCALHFLSWNWDIESIEIITKVLPIIWLACSQFRNLTGGADVKYTRLMLLGLAFSGLGDIFGEISGLGDLSFLLMVAFFMVAQFFYASAFRRYRGLKRGNTGAKLALINIVTMYLLFIAAILVISSLKSGSMLLVCACLVYALAIWYMLFNVLAHERRRYWIFAAGAMLFAISDSTIGINSFVTPIAYSGYAIMITYYAAQYLLNRRDDSGQWRLE